VRRRLTESQTWTTIRHRELFLNRHTGQAGKVDLYHRLTGRYDEPWYRLLSRDTTAEDNTCSPTISIAEQYSSLPPTGPGYGLDHQRMMVVGWRAQLLKSVFLARHREPSSLLEHHSRSHGIQSARCIFSQIRIPDYYLRSEGAREQTLCRICACGEHRLRCEIPRLQRYHS
jgi:hypothetical protein